jgi:hypothetical protein
MDHRFRKVEVKIKGIFLPILRLNREQVKDLRDGSQSYQRFLA